MGNKHLVIDTRPLPNKAAFAFYNDDARKSHVTMTAEQWKGFLSDGQKKNGLGKKEREALQIHITQQWGLLYPIDQVTLQRS